MKNRFCGLAIFCLVLAIMTGFWGCKEAVSKAKLSSFEITDQLGRTVKIEKVPERIISLAPSNTEILFALGLGDRVVGVTSYDNYPPEAKTKPSIGGFNTPNTEEVVALSPDLILATQIHQKEIIPALEKKGLIVVALAPKTLDEVLKSITLVGKVTGKDEEASRLIAEMQKRINAVTDKTDKLTETEKPRVFYVTWHDPLMTAGSGTIHDELIVKAGGINVAQGLSGFPDISLETVLEANPQVIIAGVGMGSGEDLPLQFVKNEPRLRNVDARISNRMYGVNTDLTGRAGPRIVDALEEFAKSIHPELFTEK